MTPTTTTAGAPATTERPHVSPVTAAEAALDQCAALVAALSDEAYTRPSEPLGGGTIGRHVRHCLDHYAHALTVLDDAGAVIDYDARRRDVPEEADRDAALRRISDLRAKLGRLSDQHDPEARPVTIRVMLTGDGGGADLSSTLGRELAFATHHAIHHYAMISAMCAETGAGTPDGFGRAPSTVNHDNASGH